MSSFHQHRYVGPLKAVVLDWAGTTVDHGCMAPVATFMKAFEDAGVPITVEEARAPMGMAKWKHIQAIIQTEAVRARWQEAYSRLPGDDDVDRLYQRFLPLLVQTVADYSEVIAGVVDTVAALRERGLAIASTTGYPREVMDVVVRTAKEQGYEADVTICAGDTPNGRPGPFMALEALVRLSLSPVASVVKVGDTEVDMGEGLSGGMWAVGVSVTGNEVGLNAADLAALPAPERDRLNKVATERLYAAGAHYVIDRFTDIVPVLDEIEERLAAGEKP